MKNDMYIKHMLMQIESIFRTSFATWNSFHANTCMSFWNISRRLFIVVTYLK